MNYLGLKKDRGAFGMTVPDSLPTIEWDMMDKSKFFPLSTLSSFSVRCFLYPLTVIKTRIQLQRHDQMYKGMADAWRKIYSMEGIGGLYRGFWISSIQIVNGVFYITTYEGVRHLLGQYGVNPQIRALIGGGAASLVGQTIIVPFDVLSQHLMVLGYTKPGVKPNPQMVMNPLGIALDKNNSRFKTTIDIMSAIYRRDGIMGFYKGYVASICTYVPNSAMWWAFYHLYQEELNRILPKEVSLLLIQCVAGTLGGFTTTLISNPLDIVRVRLQVQGIESMQKTFKTLWQEEHMRIFTKGLSARLVQSACFSFSIILGYETIKRLSVNEEYKDYVRW